jgi:YHS domain-containing protein
MGDAEAEPIPPEPLDYDPREDEQRPKIVARDPVCGMDVDPEGAPARSLYRGTSYYFCTLTCKAEFDLDPSRYVG